MSDRTKNNNRPTVEDKFYKQAIDEARFGLSESGIPIGAVLVKNGKVIGRGHNRRVQMGDVTAHAEIECIRSAGLFSPEGTVLYTTLAPCIMCAGATLIAGIESVVVLDRTNYNGYIDTLKRLGVEVIISEQTDWVAEFEKWTVANTELWYADGNCKKLYGKEED